MAGLGLGLDLGLGPSVDVLVVASVGSQIPFCRRKSLQ